MESTPLNLGSLGIGGTFATVILLIVFRFMLHREKKFDTVVEQLSKNIYRQTDVLVDLKVQGASQLEITRNLCQEIRRMKNEHKQSKPQAHVNMRKSNHIFDASNRPV